MLYESSHSSIPISRRPNISSAWIAGLFMSSGLSHFTIRSPLVRADTPSSTLVIRNTSESALPKGSMENHAVRTSIPSEGRTPSTKEGHSRTGVLTILSTDSIMGIPYHRGLTLWALQSCENSGKVRSDRNLIVT